MRTPATDRLDAVGVNYRLERYDEVEKTAAEAARKIGMPPGDVFKTLLVESGRDYAICVVPGPAELSLRKLARAWGKDDARMADPGAITRLTGYVRGSVSPLGTRRELRVFIDESAGGRTIGVSAGRRGLELILPAEDLLRATSGEWADLLR